MGSWYPLLFFHCCCQFSKSPVLLCRSALIILASTPKNLHLVIHIKTHYIKRNVRSFAAVKTFTYHTSVMPWSHHKLLASAACHSAGFENERRRSIQFSFKLWHWSMSCLSSMSIAVTLQNLCDSPNSLQRLLPCSFEHRAQKVSISWLWWGFASSCRKKTLGSINTWWLVNHLQPVLFDLGFLTFTSLPAHFQIDAANIWIESKNLTKQIESYEPEGTCIIESLFQFFAMSRFQRARQKQPVKNPWWHDSLNRPWPHRNWRVTNNLTVFRCFKSSHIFQARQNTSLNFWKLWVFIVLLHVNL